MPWFIGFSILLFILSILNLGLTHELFPLGIVSFEIPLSSLHAFDGILQWSSYQKRLAYLSLGLDYVFIFTYVGVARSCFLWLKAQFEARGIGGEWYIIKIISLMMILCTVTGLFDVAENSLLLKLLLSINTVTDPAQGQFYWTYLLAKSFAIAKFILIGLGLFIGGMMGLVLRSSCQRSVKTIE